MDKKICQIKHSVSVPIKSIQPMLMDLLTVGI